MVYHTKMEEDDDLEALRLAALQTIRPRSTRIVPLNTTKLDKAAFVRPVNNPNLITIIPLETIIKEEPEPVVVAPVEKKELKNDPPDSNLSRPPSDELDSVQVETKFSRFRDSDSDSDDKMSACSLEYHHSPSEDEQKETVRKKRPSNDSDEDLLALNEEDNDSLEKLMDEMEQEFSQTDTKSAGNTATSTSTSAESGPPEKKSKGGGEERRSKGNSARRYSGRKKRSHSPRRRRRSKTSARSSRSRSPLRRPSGRSSPPPRRTSWSPPRPPRKAAPSPPPSPPQPQVKERSSDKRSMKVWKPSERKPAEETGTKQREDASTGEAGAGPVTVGGGAMPPERAAPVNPVLEARRKKFESKSPVLVAPVKKKIRLKRAPATPTQETKLPSEARRIIVRQEPRQPEDRKTVLQRRKISVNIKPTALIDLEEKSKKISVHKMERDSSGGASKKDTGGAAIGGGGKASPSDTTRSASAATGEAEERAKAKANDLRAELSRRRAQRLKSAIDLFAPTRLLQSAFEGVVGKKAARIRKAVSPESTVPKLNLTGSKGRRVQVVRREPTVSLPLESGLGEPKRSSVDHGMREVHWAGGSQSIVGRSILHRSQV